MFHIFWQFGLFLGFWLLVSGSIDWQHLAFGSAASVLLVMLWHQRSEMVIGALSPRKLLLGIRALALLIREIWVAAWQVVVLVLSREIVIEPSLVRVRTILHTDRMRSLYANSITLTPGTLSVQLEQNRLLVHALTKQAAQDVVTWHYEHILKQLEDAK